MSDDMKKSYKKRLDLYTLDDEIYPPFERAKAIAEDIRKVLSDGKIFKDLVRPEIPKAMLKAVDESFGNSLIEDDLTPSKMIDSSLAETMFSSISEAIENAINGEAFINQLGLEIAQKEVAREKKYSLELGE